VDNWAACSVARPYLCWAYLLAMLSVRLASCPAALLYFRLVLSLLLIVRLILLVLLVCLMMSLLVLVLLVASGIVNPCQYSLSSFFFYHVVTDVYVYLRRA